MINSKVLMPYIAPSYSHGDDEIEFTLATVQKALSVYKLALEYGIEKYFKSLVVKLVLET